MRTITTARLVLRPATLADAAFIQELMNDPGYLARIGDRGIRTPADARAYLGTALIYRYGPDGLGFNVVERLEDGVPVGICGLVKRDGLDDVDLGYAMLSREAGRGHATEAAAATLGHARRGLGLGRVVAVTTPGNAGSRRVLEKIGMRLEGTVRLPGQDAASCLYAHYAPLA